MNLATFLSVLRPLLLLVGTALETKGLVTQEAFASALDTLFTVLTGIATLAVFVWHVVADYKKHHQVVILSAALGGAAAPAPLVPPSGSALPVETPTPPRAASPGASLALAAVLFPLLACGGVGCSTAQLQSTASYVDSLLTIANALWTVVGTHVSKADFEAYLHLFGITDAAAIAKAEQIIGFTGDGLTITADLAAKLDAYLATAK